MTASCPPPLPTPAKSLKDPVLVLFLVKQIHDKSDFREIGLILAMAYGDGLLWPEGKVVGMRGGWHYVGNQEAEVNDR